MEPEEMDEEELYLQAIGNSQERIRYLVGYLEYRFGRMGAAYPAVGAAIKKYGFPTVLLVVKTIQDIDGDSLYQRLNFNCGAYVSTKKAERTVEEQIESVQSNFEVRNRISTMKQTKKNVLSLVETMLMDGEISPEEYAEAIRDGNVAEQLVKKVGERG